MHYLPHHAVLSETKVKLVDEGNAKSHKLSKSLNECLHRGPNLIQNLGGVLLQFGMNRIALIGDIRKAYLQMQLNSEDRDVTRFLWVKDVNEELTTENIQEFRFTRVICGIISATFLLAYTIYYHLQKYETNVAVDLSRNIYVDNLISGVEDVQKAISYYNETKKIFGAAGMNMCQWNCNDENVMSNMKAEDRSEDSISKVFGIIWNRQLDTISLCRVNTESVNNTVTKREILKIISSVFDPLGLFAPILLKSKLLLQEVWKSKLKCDDIVPGIIRNSWKHELNEIKELHLMTTDRCVVNSVDKNTNYEMGAVYLREQNSCWINISLIFSKSRLAPINSKSSIPRLELLGVVIGCRASKYVADQLGMMEIRRKIFPDSKCVIEWINSENKLNRFVRERVKEIKEHNVEV